MKPLIRELLTALGLKKQTKEKNPILGEFSELRGVASLGQCDRQTHWSTVSM